MRLARAPRCAAEALTHGRRPDMTPGRQPDAGRVGPRRSSRHEQRGPRLSRGPPAATTRNSAGITTRTVGLDGGPGPGSVGGIRKGSRLRLGGRPGQGPLNRSRVPAESALEPTPYTGLAVAARGLQTAHWRGSPEHAQANLQ